LFYIIEKLPVKTLSETLLQNLQYERSLAIASGNDKRKEILDRLIAEQKQRMIEEAIKGAKK